MFFIHVFNVFYKSEKNMFLMFFICKLMFLTSMLCLFAYFIVFGLFNVLYYFATDVSLRWHISDLGSN